MACYRNQLMKMQEENESKKKYLVKVKNLFRTDETVIDKESRLEYSRIKSTERDADVSALRKMLGLPDQLDYEMDEDCKLHCLMSKVKVHWESGVNKAAFVRSTFAPNMRRFAGTRQERYANNLRRSIWRDRVRQEGLVYTGKYFACQVGDKSNLRITYVIGRLVRVKCESNPV